VSRDSADQKYSTIKVTLLATTVPDKTQLAAAAFAADADIYLLRVPIQPTCLPQSIQGFCYLMGYPAEGSLNLGRRLPAGSDEPRQLFVTNFLPRH